MMKNLLHHHFINIESSSIGRKPKSTITAIVLNNKKLEVQFR